MKLNFLKYSVYALIAVLSVVNTSIAMDEVYDPKGCDFKRTERVKRQINNIFEQNDNEPSAKITKKNSLSQRSNSDSQGFYNQEFNSQTLQETRDRYNTALIATKSDVDTDVDEDVVVNFNQSKNKNHKIKFKNKVSVRGCSNEVFIGEDEDDNSSKKTAPYRDCSKIKDEKKKEKRKRRNAENANLEAKMNEEWETLSQIEKHALFIKFTKSLSKIKTAFSKIKITKLLSEDEIPSECEKALNSFSEWKETYVDSIEILRDT